MQLHETSNLITVRYRNSQNLANGQTATIGFQGAGGGAATTVQGLVCNGKILDDNRPEDAWSVDAGRAGLVTLSGMTQSSPDDITGFATISGNDTVSNVGLPFPVTIEGIAYNSVAISTNGWFEFGGNTAADSDPSNDCLPSAAHTNPLLAAYWDDDQTIGTNIRYGSVGSSPNRTFVVDVQVDVDPAVEGNSADDLSFQVEIHEGSSLMSVRYRDKGATANGQAATIGFQGAGGASAAAYPLTCNGKILDDNDAAHEGWSVHPKTLGAMSLHAVTAFSPDDINATNIPGLLFFSGNDATQIVNLPFSVNIEGTNYSTAVLSTNGWMEFGSNTAGNSDPVNDCLPTSKHTNPFIAGFWDDMQTAGASTIQYGTVGTAPNRTFLAFFFLDTVTSSDDGNDDMKMEILVHEGSNVIAVKYPTNQRFASGQTATVGFQGVGGAAATTVMPIGCNAWVFDDNRTDAGWSVAPLPICGNSQIETKEQCDQGAANGTTPNCCSSACSFKASNVECRAAGGECDLAETCTGASVTCPSDSKKPNGTACTDDGFPCSSDQCDGLQDTCTHPILSHATLCRPLAGDCDVADFCDGANPACPSDEALTSSVVCRVSGGDCDTTEFCDGLGAQCPPDAKVPNTFVCRGAVGVCDVAELCDGATNDCPANAFQPNTTVCRAAVGDCDQAETCSGSGASCPAFDAKRPSGSVCRLAVDVCDVAEVCDGASNGCPADTLRASGFVCRVAAGTCDVDEVCSGSATSCPADQLKASGVECRASTGACDIAESCTGGNTQCPTDSIQPPGVLCRNVTGGCDVADYCDGNGKQCPSDVLVGSGVECRAADGDCDIAEVCSGSSATCPPDGFKPSTFECRALAGDCDQTEKCSGSGAQCPADAKKTTAILCRGSAGVCDVADFCDGVSDECPADVMQPSTVACRMSAGVCDLVENCNGFDPNCPNDIVAPDTTPCRAAAGVCDAVDFCDGIGKACPPDAKLTNVCRAAVGGCDVAESCDGVSNGCAAEALRTSGSVCRAAAGDCDVAETCDGSSTDCPADALRASGVVCRPATEFCDVAEACDGIAAACRTDMFRAEGDGCAGNDDNFCKNACRSGVCAPELVPNCCGNGVPDAGEQCDDGNQSTAIDGCPSSRNDDCTYSGFIRGERTKPAKDKNGCQLEYFVVNPSNLLDKFSLPDRDQTCADNDPTCDADPTTGRCRMTVVMCLNTTDASLECLQPRTGISSVLVKPVPLKIASAPTVGVLALTNTAAVNNALSALLDPQNPDAGYTNGVPIAGAQTNLCSAPMAMDLVAIAKPSDKAKRRLTIRTVSKDGTFPRPKGKRTMLRLLCTP